MEEIHDRMPIVILQGELDFWRDNSLKVVCGFETMQYTFTRTEPTVPGVSPIKSWSGTATQTSGDDKQFVDDEHQVGETITVGTPRCDRFGDSNASWKCQSSTTGTWFSQISNVLMGKPRLFVSDVQIMAFSSSQKAYKGKQCRSFDVQYKAIYGVHAI